MAHAGGLYETLAALQDILPLVPDRLRTLVLEEAALKAAAEEFLQSVEERQAEASELFTRIEASLTAMRRQATEQALLLQQYPDFGAVLDQESLAFEEKLLLFLSLFMNKQQAVIDAKKGAMEKMVGFDSLKESAVSSLKSGLEEAQGRVGEASNLVLQGSEGLGSTVEASRTAVTDEVEKLGAEMEAQRTAGTRDVDQMKRDMEGFEAVFVGRVERLRDLVRDDADRIVTETKIRVDDLRILVWKAVGAVQDSLKDLERKLNEATEESAEARNMLVPMFESLERQLGPLKDAMESVREAAHVVGVPF